jgi:hypothetical protein
MYLLLTRCQELGPDGLQLLAGGAQALTNHLVEVADGSFQTRDATR